MSRCFRGSGGRPRREHRGERRSYHRGRDPLRRGALVVCLLLGGKRGLPHTIPGAEHHGPFQPHRRGGDPQLHPGGGEPAPAHRGEPGAVRGPARLHRHLGHGLHGQGINMHIHTTVHRSGGRGDRLSASTPISDDGTGRGLDQTPDSI